jgi:hypothetical protein
MLHQLLAAMQDTYYIVTWTIVSRRIEASIHHSIVLVVCVVVTRYVEQLNCHVICSRGVNLMMCR